MTEKEVFRGRLVGANWRGRLAGSQNEPEYQFSDGRSLVRVRYGEEEHDWRAECGPCHDCLAVAGEFHVPGCDVEQCPSCGGQAMSCGCRYEGDQEPEE